MISVEEKAPLLGPPPGLFRFFPWLLTTIFEFFNFTMLKISNFIISKAQKMQEWWRSNWSNQFKSLSNLTFSQSLWLFLLFWLLSWECCESSRKVVLFWFWHGKKREFWIEWGWVFHVVNLKNYSAIVIPHFSTIHG